jgi:hypothetical protein
MVMGKVDIHMWKTGTRPQSHSVQKITQGGSKILMKT